MLQTINRKSELPSLVDEFFKNDFFGNFPVWNRHESVPSVNITESNKGYTIELAAPGLSKEDYKIDLEDHVLTISAIKEAGNEETKDRFIRKEFSYSSFSRCFSLPEDVDEDKINAKQKDGILFIEIPRREEAVNKISKAIEIS